MKMMINTVTSQTTNHLILPMTPKAMRMRTRTMMPNQTSPKKTLRKKKTIVIFQRTKMKILPKIKKRKKQKT